MAKMASNPTRAVKTVLMLACAFALLACAQAAFAQGGVRRTLTATPTDGAPYSVTLEQCVTSTAQTERSATFTAQMTATSATQRMGMRIELQQRQRGEPAFHTIIASGFGMWRSSEPGVKIYKYVKQVTNLAAPAAYRAVVRFRWLGDRGHVLKRAELHTSRCLQPTLPMQVTQTPASVPGA
jgi:uncharacterized protein (DUF58 family)